ncbi:lysostaphin resistance A-like protein [uncultured Bradyrhizobium sp.]|uniref:CPBP family intramembrane glutamic endopeptidase n=1 Tax=uncultured Bradyrhizobium sp. TaxID=199684 RepID=UPI0035CB6243
MRISETSVPALRQPRVWKFVGTSLWGLVIFAAMFAGQMLVVGYFVLSRGASADLDLVRTVLSSGVAISMSVIMGLPAVLAALWLATRVARAPFAEYLALRWTSWSNLLAGIAGLIVLIAGWDLLSRAVGREIAPGFMVDVLKSARADGALWLLALAFCAVAPATEEFFVRGFLYRGWSQSFLHPAGAIVLSSLVWTAMHLQYDLFFLGEVFSIGLLLGYLRYRSGSTWLTVVLHGINNLAATLQSIWLAGP